MAEQSLEDKEVNRIVPGVTAAYRALIDKHGHGLLTSNGRFYNHTIFGRDASMSAKFVIGFDRDVVWETIKTLASKQGVKHSDITQEERGRIHHELRDYTTWRGGLYNRIGMKAIGISWGMRGKKLLTYFAADTTADYIRLIHKYWRVVDKNVLTREIRLGNSQSIALGESVYRAAKWLVDQVDVNGLFVVRRHNRWSLPYQTFTDSVTAYTARDGHALNTARTHSFIEVHIYALDAICDAMELLEGDARIAGWQEVAAKMRQVPFDLFWDEKYDNFSAAVAFDRGKIQRADGAMITNGWTLNASFWYDLPTEKHRERLEKIIRRLFRDDILTDVGIRTKSTDAYEPLGRDIDYHGSRTVWPMFNFMVIEGLRRHGFYKLAEQLENRVLNGVNAIGDFTEFFIVDHDKTLYRADAKAKTHRRGQMIPEQNIAFTVVPVLVMARRKLVPELNKSHGQWQDQFEAEILSSIEHVELLPAEKAVDAYKATPLRIDRTWCGIRSALHIAPVILSKYGKDSRRSDIGE